jgi:hypothetical protein
MSQSCISPIECMLSFMQSPYCTFSNDICYFLLEIILLKDCTQSFCLYNLFFTGSTRNYFQRLNQMSNVSSRGPNVAMCSASEPIRIGSMIFREN